MFEIWFNRRVWYKMINQIMSLMGVIGDGHAQDVVSLSMSHAKL